ncbi:MAG TPA: hypothetical protein GXX37_00350 [Clostridiaceae bacterium]|nr:hypothetical protein [Clostridiaceae bacterium]
MIIYSIIPNEIIFASNKDCPEMLEVEYEGEKVEVYERGRNEYVINRIISSSPKAFLNKNLQPGTVIKTNIKFAVK